MKWYYVRQGVKIGPLGDDEMRRCAELGELVGQDLVWRPGFSEWLRADQVEGLFSPPPLPAETAPTPEPAECSPTASSTSTASILSNCNQPDGKDEPASNPRTTVESSVPVISPTVEKELSTRWLTFWVGLRLPLGALLNLSAVLIRQESLSRMGIVVGIACSMFMLVVAIGLGKRRLWAWWANWMLIVGEWIAVSVRYARQPEGSAGDLLSGAGPFIVLGLVWVLPNYFYFKKRRKLFKSLAQIAGHDGDV